MIPRRKAWVAIALAAAAAAPPGLPAAHGQTSRATTTSQPVAPDRAALLKVWSCRAARAQTALRLVEQIRQLRAGEGKVGDLLDESPPLSMGLALFALAQPEAEPARHSDDGNCRATLVVRPVLLAGTLEILRERYDHLGKFKPGDFLPIARQSALTATGVAPADPAFLQDPPIPYQSGEDYFSRAAPAARTFWLRHVSAPGRVKAEQAARQDSLRRLAERIKQVRTRGSAHLGDLAGRYGLTELDMGQFLRGAREAGMRYYGDAPVVEAVSETPLRTVLACVKSWLQAQKLQDPGEVRALEEMIIAAGETTIRQIGLARVEAGQLVDADASMITDAALASNPPPWVGFSLRADGRGNADGSADPVAARQQAIRAAEWDARFALARRLAELPVGNSTNLETLALTQPRIRTAILALLQDAEPVAEPTVSKEGLAEVTLEVSTTPLWHLLFDLQRRPRPVGSLPAATRPLVTRPTTRAATAPASLPWE